MIITILAAIIALGVVILFHEIGHLIVAKRNGVKVKEFSIGFGPKIIGITRGETLYQLSLVPLGGYVRMAGDNPDEPLSGEGYEFFAKPPWTRIKIVFAGAGMNFVVAIFAYWLVFMLGIPSLHVDNRIGRVQEGSAAAKADLKVGDYVLKINDREIEDWTDISETVIKHPGESLALLISRQGENLTVHLGVEKDEQTGLGFAGLGPFLPSKAGSIKEGYPAQISGLAEGDLITEVNGTPVSQWQEMANLIHQFPEQEITMKVKRGEKTFTIGITPVATETMDEKGEAIKVGLIGVGPPTIIKKAGPIGAIIQGGEETLNATRTVFFVLSRLITGQLSAKLLAGPLGIAQMAGEQVRGGLSAFLAFIAFLSANLGVLNLLPIPILDGGHIVFFIVERIRRKKLDTKIHELAQQIGLTLLVCLMIYVTLNDIRRAKVWENFKELYQQWVEKE
ncbi:MAG: RIP metalloprotease RseP [bacterium]|nr:RIP metalloprotease RseP [bacterium]